MLAGEAIPVCCMRANDGPRGGASEIFSMRNSFEVVRPDASRIGAQMVEFEPIRNLSVGEFVSDTVSEGTAFSAFSFGANHEYATSIRTLEGSMPLPAFIGFLDLRPEALLERELGKKFEATGCVPPHVVVPAPASSAFFSSFATIDRAFHGADYTASSVMVDPS